MPVKWRINWKGDDVLARVRAAARMGVDDTMAAAVNYGKSNHPGWNNVTGTAEGSFAIQEPARHEGTRTRGRWGSQGVSYVLPLEVLHGSALRNAADQEYPTLKRRIQEHIR